MCEWWKSSDLLQIRRLDLLDLDQLGLTVGQLHCCSVHHRYRLVVGSLIHLLVPGVDLFMVPQVGEGPEGFAALRAGVRPLAGVRAAVFGQMHALDETFPAHLTAERPLARVGA